MDGAYDVGDRRGVVQRRQSHEYVHLPHSDQLTEQRIGKRACLIHGVNWPLRADGPFAPRDLC